MPRPIRAATSSPAGPVHHSTRNHRKRADADEGTNQSVEHAGKRRRRTRSATAHGRSDARAAEEETSRGDSSCGAQHRRRAHHDRRHGRRRPRLGGEPGLTGLSVPLQRPGQPAVRAGMARQPPGALRLDGDQPGRRRRAPPRADPRRQAVQRGTREVRRPRPTGYGVAGHAHRTRRGGPHPPRVRGDRAARHRLLPLVPHPRRVRPRHPAALGRPRAGARLGAPVGAGALRGRRGPSRPHRAAHPLSDLAAQRQPGGVLRLQRRVLRRRGSSDDDSAHGHERAGAGDVRPDDHRGG